MWCRVLSLLKLYLTSTNYVWMFCEGYYLHRLISNAFEPPKNLVVLYACGWGKFISIYINVFSYTIGLSDASLGSSGAQYFFRTPIPAELGADTSISIGNIGISALFSVLAVSVLAVSKSCRYCRYHSISK